MCCLLVCLFVCFFCLLICLLACSFDKCNVRSSRTHKQTRHFFYKRKDNQRQTTRHANKPTTTHPITSTQRNDVRITPQTMKTKQNKTNADAWASKRRTSTTKKSCNTNTRPMNKPIVPCLLCLVVRAYGCFVHWLCCAPVCSSFVVCLFVVLAVVVVCSSVCVLCLLFNMCSISRRAVCN